MHYKLALSIREACEAAGVGRTVLYEEITKGRLVAHKRGRRTLIKASELERWLDELPKLNKLIGSGQSGSLNGQGDK
jgi:excisionase family DNA binding protein